MITKKAPYLSIIVPTLNEEEHIGFLLSSISQQSSVSHEVLIVDGGSKDTTTEIARKHNAKVIVLPGCGEFKSRNSGAKIAKGRLLLFTCADIIFPEDLFLRIVREFERVPEMIALTGPGYPFDASLFGKIEYLIYNAIRSLFAKFPQPFKRFSTSTNFLVVRKDIFETIGGFSVNEINADGLMGKKLSQMGIVAFSMNSYVGISARRMKNMGFLGFNKHYLYVFENLFYFLSKTTLMKTLKRKSKRRHKKIHIL